MSDVTELGFLGDLVDRALAEDLASGDVTTRSTIDASRRARARIVARSETVVAALAVLEEVFRRCDPAVRVEVVARDGDRLPAGALVATLEASARGLLAGERTALNLLQRACGVATLTRAFVDAAGGRCRVVDTRKTMPGLRALDRYAVRCGGGHNHRNDLGSGVLIKENHIRATGGITAAVRAARAKAAHGLRIQCEVTTPAEVDEALAAGADALLLDNMDDEQIRRAVGIVNARAVIEVSGGLTVERVGVVAGLGVDLVSVGALTHSAPAADLSLLFDLP